ncbi:hypothetical protein IH981_02000 [Patescibacteria group bacterium]|nr:hypothetical protein [Patescibacteria group bacterium]
MPTSKDYSSFTGRDNDTQALADLVTQSFGSYPKVTEGDGRTEWWDEGSESQNYFDFNNFFLASDWDINDELSLTGRSLSASNSSNLVARIIVFSTHEEVLESVPFRSVLLPGKIYNREFLKLSEIWYKGYLNILVQKN